jgi:hypothetical protein
MFGLGWELYSKVEKPPEPLTPSQIESTLTFLTAEARGGLKRLKTIWAGYSEEIRTAILRDYADEWTNIKSMAQAED